ncbi:hypothetical protein MHBO_001763 [Bonamia ostreae]|uniref:Importin N-terminal domain-containing protein n=1 Tax=Bonamia ostreae TaxID=126728 RepID=A0ABV2AK31_9EUKA
MSSDMDEFTRNVFENCKVAFSPNSSNDDRQKASIFLQNLGETDASFLVILEKIFSATTTPEILIFFSNLTLKTIEKFWGSIETSFLLNLRSFLIEYLKNAKIDKKSVINCIARVPCRIAKMGWTEDIRYKNMTETIASFLSTDIATCNRGILVLSIYIEEINKSGNTNRIKNRRISSQFRDKELFNIFKLSVVVLNRIIRDNNFGISDQEGNSLVESALDLTSNCLNFDFIGTIRDESSDDLKSLQIPEKWSELLNPSYSDDNKNHIVKICFQILRLMAKSDFPEFIKSKCICKVFGQILLSLF